MITNTSTKIIALKATYPQCSHAAFVEPWIGERMRFLILTPAMAVVIGATATTQCTNIATTAIPFAIQTLLTSLKEW
ncbi:hypothetical protein LO82_13725 [Vibrio vulnificus]|nr:hypothetical protein LO82_13725 [Vibrio vulnificus]